METFFNVFIGILAGVCTGLGLGGGSVLILLLTLFMGFEQHVAQATNLICFIPSATLSVLINLKRKNIDLKNAIPITLFGVIGAIIGAVISENLNVLTLRKFFGTFLLLICFYEIHSYYNSYITGKKRHNNCNKI